MTDETTPAGHPEHVLDVPPADEMVLTDSVDAIDESADLERAKALMEDALRLAEGLIFASPDPVTARALDQLLDDSLDVHIVLDMLRARYAGRGVELAEVSGGWLFRTAPDLSPRLKKIVQQPRRLPRAAMETLAIISYHQPITRPEIEEIRGAALSQTTMDALLEAGLITAKGRKEVPGRPTLWGTTNAFLLQFGLRDLRDLPRREDLLVEPGTIQPIERPQTAEPELPPAEQLDLGLPEEVVAEGESTEEEVAGEELPEEEASGEADAAASVEEETASDHTDPVAVSSPPVSC